MSWIVWWVEQKDAWSILETSKESSQLSQAVGTQEMFPKVMAPGGVQNEMGERVAVLHPQGDPWLMGKTHSACMGQNGRSVSWSQSLAPCALQQALPMPLRAAVVCRLWLLAVFYCRASHSAVMNTFEHIAWCMYTHTSVKNLPRNGLNMFS